MALETSNFLAIRNFTAVGWETSPALWGCSLLCTSLRNSSTAWTDVMEDMQDKSRVVCVCEVRLMGMTTDMTKTRKSGYRAERQPP